MSAPVGILDGSVAGMPVTLGVSSTRVAGDEWLLGTVSSSVSNCGDAW